MSKFTVFDIYRNNLGTFATRKEAKMYVGPRQRLYIVSDPDNPRPTISELLADMGIVESVEMKKLQRTAGRITPQKRGFPKWKPTMTTAEYVVEFELMNYLRAIP